MSRYYEDFELGERFVTPGRTITEADVALFAGLSGDFNPIHTDEEVARRSSFGRRIAHGPLGIALVSGLISRLGLFEETAIAYLGLEWSFRAPIFIGDTLHVEFVAGELRETRDPSRGILVRMVELVNQEGVTVQEGKSTVMLKRRRVAEAAA
jgi:acyl dehydratase